MSLDQQVAAILQQLATLVQPDFEQLRAPGVRKLADHMMPPHPGEPMQEVRDLRVAGAAGELDARLYRPLDQPDLPLLVWFHGGGFVTGNLDTHDILCRSLARQVGAVVVAIDYRLAPEAKFPAAPFDCYHATCWLVEHAAELGCDPSRLALAGDSAGANLAIAVSRLSAARRGPRISYQCLFYPVTDARCLSASYKAFADGYFLTREMMRWFWRQYLVSAEQADEPLASPLNAWDLESLPATTVITAEFDVLRDEGEAFARRLQQAGVPTRLQRCDGMIHGFISMAPFVERAAEALRDAAADLRAVLGRQTAVMPAPSTG